MWASPHAYCSVNHRWVEALSKPENLCDGLKIARPKVTQPPYLLSTYILLISIPDHPGE